MAEAISIEIEDLDARDPSATRACCIICSNTGPEVRSEAPEPARICGMPTCYVCQISDCD